MASKNESQHNEILVDPYPPTTRGLGGASKIEYMAPSNTLYQGVGENFFFYSIRSFRGGWSGHVKRIGYSL